MLMPVDIHREREISIAALRAHAKAEPTFSLLDRYRKTVCDPASGVTGKQLVFVAETRVVPL